MDEVMQGTTPSLEIEIDKTDFLVGDVAELKMIFMNGLSKAIHRLSDFDQDAEANSFTYRFSQEETLALDPFNPIVVKGRAKFSDNSVVGIKEIRIEVSDLEDDEIL